ncbi:hypothetical protein BG004_004370 [Podila humilis]|nr:hypothetical protein BG004_004370 [Podila humilis]
MASFIRHSRRKGVSFPTHKLFAPSLRALSVTSPASTISSTTTTTTAPSSSSTTAVSKAGDSTTTFTPGPSPREQPTFQYGDVLILNDNKGDRRLIGPLQPKAVRDTNFGRLFHDQFIGLAPTSTVTTHKGITPYTVHWPTLDEYCTKVKRQATIMYPKDATSAVHLLDLFPGAHVLEAGTGNGSMTMYIQRAIQSPKSHLDTVDIRSAHSMQAEQNIERFWRGMYRPGITFWRSVGGLQRVIKRLTGQDIKKDTFPASSPSLASSSASSSSLPAMTADMDNISSRSTSEEKEDELENEDEKLLPENPHPAGHQYDAISLDLPDTKQVLLDLYPLLKVDRPLVLYMVNMSQILEMVQWLRKKNFEGYTLDKVVEIEWREWSVRSAAVRSKVQGRVRVGGLGAVSLLPPPPLTTAANVAAAAAAAGTETQGEEEEDSTLPSPLPTIASEQEGMSTTTTGTTTTTATITTTPPPPPPPPVNPHTAASDNIPDDAVGWVCRPLHKRTGHTGFLVQLRKNSV